MTTVYKLTTHDRLTRAGEENETQWGPGIEHTAPGIGNLCTSGWLHAYEHLLVAVLMNPVHANIKKPRLWEAEGDVGPREGSLKCGCRRLRTIRELPLPVITREQCVRAAIYLAGSVFGDDCPEWSSWADGWLSGADRGRVAARAAAVARAAAWAAEWAAARAAEWAAAGAAEWAAAAAAAAWAAEAVSRAPAVGDNLPFILEQAIADEMGLGGGVL